MQTALHQILAWGVDNIQEYAKTMIAPYLKAFEEMGFTIEDESYRCSHLLGMRAPSDLNLELIGQKLKEANIHVSVRGNAIRLATSVYNSKRDLDQFYAVLHRNLAVT